MDNLARPGTLRLAPPEPRMPELASDYRATQAMLFGNCPTLEEIAACLRRLEETVNGCA